MIVAQGSEAGGHTGRISTLALIPLVVDAVAPLPVIAAGGIGDGRGLAAALMLGAEGAWLGTAFLCSPESGYSPAQKQRVLDIGPNDTVLSESFDIFAKNVWPQGVVARAARNEISDRWHGHEEELRSQIDTVRAQYEEALKRRALSVDPVWAGASAGMVTRSEPAGEIVRRIADEAQRIIAERGRLHY